MTEEKKEPVVEEKKETDSPIAEFVNTRKAAQELFDMFD